MAGRGLTASIATALAIAGGCTAAGAANVTLGNHEIVLSGVLVETDRVSVAQSLGRWLAGTGRSALILRLDRVSGDVEAAKRILRFLVGMMESGLTLEIVTNPADPCPEACAVLRDGYDDPEFIATLESYRGYRIPLYDGRWVAAPSGRGP